MTAQHWGKAVFGQTQTPSGKGESKHTLETI